MFDTINVTSEGAIGEIVLNRPDKLNALSTQLLAEIVEAARWFDTQSEIKVVILRGNGRVFSAGADLTDFQQITSLRDAGDLGRQMANALEEMQAIVIAAIHGWCVGGALVMAAACDLRLAAEDTRFSIPEVDLGIPLAWGGIPRLVREIGPTLTKELVITCRPFDAAEARTIGFLNQVVSGNQLIEAATTLARQIADKPGLPIFASKRHTNAVTAQMIGATRSWSDADSLVAAAYDAECIEARNAYLSQKLGGK